MKALGNHPPGPVRLHIYTLVFRHDPTHNGENDLSVSSTTQSRYKR